MSPPCNDCYNYAGVILAQMDAAQAPAKPAAHDWDLNMVPGYCKKCSISYLNPLASEPCDQRSEPACKLCNDTGIERLSSHFADGTPAARAEAARAAVIEGWNRALAGAMAEPSEHDWDLEVLPGRCRRCDASYLDHAAVATPCNPTIYPPFYSRHPS
jgi:predicted Zn-ribbon and HTH transcriptional regulator